jgi:hypothetical protein
MVISKTANSDGLIKCLPPTHDSFSVKPKIYALKFYSIYKMLWHPDSFISRDSILGRRADALVPCFLLAI